MNMCAVSPPNDFDEFFRQSYAELARLGFSLTGRRDVAEELVQDTMAKAFGQWKRLLKHDRPDLWCKRVLINDAYSRSRKLTREASALLRRGRDATEVSDIADFHAAEEFARAVSLLPRRQAQVVVLTYLSQLSSAEVASVIGCSESTVRVHLHSARQTLSTTWIGPAHDS